MLKPMQIKILLWVMLACLPLAARSTALDQYVAKADSAYAYRHYDTDERLVYTTYFLTMTSQRWRDASEVDRPLWQHHLFITVPRLARFEKNKLAILFIDGGSNNGRLPNDTPREVELLATLTKSVVAVIRQVPNQPLYFRAETPRRARKEDQILAYSFDRFLDSCNGALADCDKEWPVHLAMTKAAVRAMDTVQAFLAKKSVPIKEFVVTGASKRGWTAYLTGAVDKRVKGIVPISIDIPNLHRQVDHHWAAYGGQYSPQLDDYTEFDIFCRAKGSLAGLRLRNIVDPFRYRNRLTMPKLIINSAGDGFFLPDSSRRYFRALRGEKALRYTFNTKHDQNGALNDVALRAISWVNNLRRGSKNPRYSWQVKGNQLILTTEKKAESVWLWSATDAVNHSTRDFRLNAPEVQWKKRRIQARGDGKYTANLKIPPTGWSAYSMEVFFKEPRLLSVDQSYTTDVIIVPKRLPVSPTEHCQFQGPTQK